MNTTDPGSDASFDGLRHAHRSERAPEELRRLVNARVRRGGPGSERAQPRRPSRYRGGWLALAAAVVVSGVWFAVPPPALDSASEQTAAGHDLATPRAEPTRPSARAGSCPAPVPSSTWAPGSISASARVTGLEAQEIETETAGCGPLTRRYLVRASATHTALTPVLIVLHDGGQSAEQGQVQTRWWFDDVTQRQSAVLVYANGGPSVAPSTDRAVHGGVWQTDAGAHPAVDDVAYLQAIVTDLRARRGLAQGDVFLSGYGSGAVMAIAAALQHPERYTGVAAFLPARTPRKEELGAALSAPGPQRLRSIFVVQPRTADENPSTLAFEWAATLGSEPGGVHVTRQRPGIRRVDSTLAGGVELRLVGLPEGVSPFPGPGGGDDLTREASQKLPTFFDGPGAAWDFFQRVTP